MSTKIEVFEALTVVVGNQQLCWVVVETPCDNSSTEYTLYSKKYSKTQFPTKKSAVWQFVKDKNSYFSRNTFDSGTTMFPVMEDEFR